MIGTWLFTLTAFADASVSVSLHDQWISGNRLNLSIRYENSGTEPVTVPDLANRPWLVEFHTVDPNGTKSTIHSTPPERDPGGTIQLNSGERRITRFEVPTSEMWPNGTATVRLNINGYTTENHSIQMLDPSLNIEAQAAEPADKTAGERTVLMTVTSPNRTDLFIKTPNGFHFLERIAGKAKAQLSVARTEQRIGRWITWTDGNNELWAAQHGAHGFTDTPRRIPLPWPGASTCGPPATANTGHLVTPVCVRSPTGKVVKTVAAIVPARGNMQFRTISQYGADAILTNVDSSGGVEFILVRDNAIDWAWLGASTTADRPTSIKKVWRGNGLRSAKIALSEGSPPTPIVQAEIEGEPMAIELPSPR